MYRATGGRGGDKDRYLRDWDLEKWFLTNSIKNLGLKVVLSTTVDQTSGRGSLTEQRLYTKWRDRVLKRGVKGSLAVRGSGQVSLIFGEGFRVPPPRLQRRVEVNRWYVNDAKKMPLGTIGPYD